MNESIKPTRIFDFGNHVRIIAFGRPTNWSMSHLTLEAIQKGSDEANFVFFKIKDVSAYAGIHLMYAPRPSTFNANICMHGELGVGMFTNHDAMVEAEFPDNWDFSLYRGVDADGCDLHPNSALALASADCPTIVVRSLKTGRVIPSHAGRDCLFDRTFLLEGYASRKHDSVVDTIMDWFRTWKEDPQNLEVFITCGIGALNFPHPTTHRKFGKTNQKLIDHFRRIGDRVNRECVLGNPKEGKLNLQEIIRAQFMSHGVPTESIAYDGIDTYSDLDEKGEYLWHSSARGKTPEEKASRNLVIVYHHGS